MQRVCGKWDAKSKKRRNGEYCSADGHSVPLVIVGFVANRLGYTNAESDKKLSGLIFDFTCPALVLSSVMGETLPDSRLVLPLLG